MSDTSKSQRFQSPEVRQRQVLDAAAELLVELGYDKMSMALVARRAGIAKGTVYLYFKSKQAMVEALQAEMIALMLDDPEAGVGSWSAQLDRLVERWVHFDTQHMQLHHAVFHERPTGGIDPFEACTTRLIAILQGGIDAGEFSIASVEVTAQFLIHGYCGLCFGGSPTEPHTHNHEKGACCQTPAGMEVEGLILTVQRLFRRVVGASLNPA